MGHTENNKLIAEFMEYEQEPNNADLYHTGHFYETDGGFPNQEDVYGYDEMHFHSSWNWLMPVVEKCKDIGYRGTEYDDELYQKWELLFGDDLSFAFLGNYIDEVYDACVEFIKWYNENKV